MNPETLNLLDLKEVTKSYGSAKAVDACSLSFRAGEVHALLGANGAGKSTLVRMVAGLTAMSEGAMAFCGEDYAPAGKRDAEAVGIEIVQQELNLIPTLSVAENLFLADLPAAAGVIRRGVLRQRARAALDRVGLSGISTEAEVATLGIGQQQMVEIAAALNRKCRLLILDEPTAALTSAESETLFDRLRGLRSDGVGIIYISHRLDEVAMLADSISVLRDGCCVGTFAAADCSTDRMIELMSGQAMHRHAEHASFVDQRSETLRVEGLTGGLVKDVSFQLHRGEKLGIAGLVGSGRSELLRLVFGADVATAGGVCLGEGDALQSFRHPSEAVAAGIAMVTESRKENGLLLPASVQTNTTLVSMWQRFVSFGMVRSQAEADAARSQCDALNVRCESLQQRIATLSGGNQQKIVLAKWLVHDADIFLLDEPTRGIDVAARHRIYQLVDALAADGKSIVMVSSDLDELLDVCDRIAVMSNGRLVETFKRESWSYEGIMQAVFSGYRRGRTG